MKKTYLHFRLRKIDNGCTLKSFFSNCDSKNPREIDKEEYFKDIDVAVGKISEYYKEIKKYL